MTDNQFTVLVNLIKIGFAGLHKTKEGMMIFNGAADELFNQYRQAQQQKAAIELAEAESAKPNASNEAPKGTGE